MKRLKQALSLSLALVLSLAMAAPAFADQEFDLQGQYTSGAYTYNLLADGTAMIVEFNKNYSTYTTLETLTIPATLDGHKVTSLGTYSFSYSMPNGIKTVVIPEGVTHINSSAFSYRNTTTTSLVLPSTLQSIGESAFNGWKALNTLEIPESVTSIGANAFFIFDPQEGQGLKTVICHSKNVQLGNGGLFDSTPFDGCVNCKFYGYPGSTLEKLVQNRLSGTTGNTFHDISEAPATGTPSQPEQPTTPTQPQQPTGTKTANPTNDKLAVNGAEQTPTVYKIGGSNYFKIRDVAAVLNGTEKQFNVGYAGGKVTVTSNHSYDTATGKELKGAPTSSKSATRSNDTIIIDGKEASLTVYKIGGSNYFKLRDLGEALDFYVGWEAGKGVFIETDRPYSK